MKSIFVYYTITITITIRILSDNINYHQLSSAISIILSWCMGATNLMLYAFSIYRRVRRRSYYFIYITYITITIMRYAYIIYFTITITCIAITIIIMIYFRKKFWVLFTAIYSRILWVIPRAKNTAE